MTVLTSPSSNPFSREMATCGLSIIAVLQRNRDVAQEQYTALQPLRGSVNPIYGCADKILGLLAQTIGNLELAIAHFEVALALCRKAGYRPELAWTCCDYADTLLQRSDPGDREKALSLLDESLALSSELGMPPLVERVVGLQERSESQPVPTPTYPGGLTEREAEILRLVSAGMSNPEIGEELFISPRTVSTHVSNILNKIGAANRIEATRYALERNLAEGQ